MKNNTGMKYLVVGVVTAAVGMITPHSAEAQQREGRMREQSSRQQQSYRQQQGDRQQQGRSQQQASRQRQSAKGGGQQEVDMQLKQRGSTLVGIDHDLDRQLDTFVYLPNRDLRTARESSRQKFRQEEQRADRSGREFRDSQGTPRLKRDEWAVVAYDFDRDDQVDAYEYIAEYDIKRASRGMQNQQQGRGQQQSQRQRQPQDRQQASRQQGAQGRQQFQDRQQQQQRQQARVHQDGIRASTRTDGRASMSDRSQRQQPDIFKISGTISDTHTIKPTGMNQSHIVAAIEGPDSRKIAVDLGPQSEVKRLNLSEGDTITAFASQGRINERDVLMAHRLSAQGNTVDISRERGPQLQKVEGQIQSVQTKTFSGRQGEFLVGEVRLDNGATRTVNFGPAKELRGANLSRGNEISFLGEEARISGEQGFLALQVSKGDQSFETGLMQSSFSRKQ